MKTVETPAIDFCLDFQYSESNRNALKAVSGTVGQGRCIVLCGSSGCGKSTLLRCINQLIPQFYEGKLKGFCRINGKDTQDLSIGQTGRLAASVFQDPRSQFFTLNSSTELAFGLENFGVSHEEMVKRVDGIFNKSGLNKLRDRNVFALSSGERQLTAILAARALDTDLYLLDEPTANLDYSAVNQLSQQLKLLKAQGRTLFISEHRLYYLNSIADEYWLMEKGEIVRRIRAEEMRTLSQAELHSMGLRTNTLEQVKLLPKKAEELKGSHRFKAECLQFKYHGSSHKVLKGITLEAETGDVIGLIGSNGCGKTTFGKLAAGLYKPLSGSISFDNRKFSSKELSAKAIFIMQEAEFQFFTNSVMNELCYGHKRSDAFMAELHELLTGLDLWQCRNQHPFSLSGGQMQKLVLLLAYLSPKPIAVLDEPTAGLDYHSLSACAGLIRRMQQEKLVFIISHDLELIAQVCTRAIIIKDGIKYQEFVLSDPAAFDALRDYMIHHLSPAESPGQQINASSAPKLDPRPKFLIFLTALIVGIGTCASMILCSYLSVLSVLIYERKWKLFCTSTMAMGLIFLLYQLWSGVVTAFLISFFPRVILICAAAMMLVREEDAPAALAGLRKLHVPETLIMTFSVTFRFFPVLSKDISIMNQSLKTRGFFPRLKDKLKEAPEYLEILVVPMVFRVIRIAEALSASAETRGISMKVQRESYIDLHLRAIDICFICLSVVLTALGLFI